MEEIVTLTPFDHQQLLALNFLEKKTKQKKKSLDESSDE
jgi:hypothetical protein